MKKFNKSKKSTVRVLRPVLALLLAAMVAFPLSVVIAFTNSSGTDGQSGLEGHIIDTVSPAHVTFNLFDYWFTEQSAPTNDRGNGNWGNQMGINAGHPFIFWSPDSSNGDWNLWTGDWNHTFARPGYVNDDNVKYGEYKGIVEDVLGEDGYPVLNLGDRSGNSFITNNGLGGTLNESLAYLFDPDASNDYKASYENVQGLVKYNGKGGYIYNSHENFAEFKQQSNFVGVDGNESAGYFDVYESWALPAPTSPNGQFFPFDSADEVFRKNAGGSFETDEGGKLVSVGSKPASLNYFIGLTMETVFLQPKDGVIDEDGTPMSFTFSGDDDVWIFIDDVLVSDIGGVHDECFTVIDFQTGRVYTGLTPVTINESSSYEEEIPPIEKLREGESNPDMEWEWYDRDTGRSVDGTYAEFKRAHGITGSTLYDIFDSAGRAGNQSWVKGDGQTFDHNTQHELKMFYLERGAGASNLVLEFNMLAVPASGVTKTDQDGRPVEGATFELWPAEVDGNGDPVGTDGNPIDDLDSGPSERPDVLFQIDYDHDFDNDGSPDNRPICTAATDENGHLNFVTENRKIISFQELAGNGMKYFVLRETAHPVGYRNNGDISLYYSQYGDSSGDGVLLSYNYWKTGAYTQAKLSVTMTDELYEYVYTDGSAGPEAGDQIGAGESDTAGYLDNGIIFAVPVKRIDTNGSLYDESNFHAVYGTMHSGWTMMSDSIENKESVLEAAKKMVEVMRQTHQTGTIIAERNAKNLFHIEMTNLPGDVKLSYPYLMESGREDESQYNLAFYFAPNVDSLDDIEDIDSIVRIAAQTKPDANGEAEMFVREYSSQFYVPNALNRVRIQKMDYQGNRLTGAVFTMYQAYSAAEREGYMPVTSGEYAGMYYNPQVVNQDGTLKTRGEILNAAPWDSGATTSEEATVEGGLSLDGAMIFPTAFDEYVIDSTSGAATGDYDVNPDDTSTFMEEGEYVIYETESPQGYEVNLNPIRVTVNDSGVYADAGGENDGVRVGQYAGMVLNSMTNFAAENVVDQSLTFLDTTLMVQGNNGLEAPQEGEITWLNKYSNEHGRYVFYADDVARYVTSGRNLYQFTESGTPQLVVKQCDHIYSYVLILGGEYSGYDGPVYLTKSSVNTGGAVTEETVEVTAKDGTLAYWLLKGDNGNVVQSLAGVEVAGADGRRIPLDETQYAAYEPRMDGLSGYDDLSGLLSVETLVQVYDRGVGSLRVTKHTENNDTNQGEPFRFRVYSVYENATKIVLAKFRDGQIVYKNDVNGNPTGEPETVPYNGVLNIRLRQDSSDEHSQYTAVNISAEFENGVSMIYLHDGYSVENIYLPENADHPLYAGKEENIEIAGRVETRITLDDSSVSGNAEVVAGHVAFENNSVTHTLNFENGSATYYRNPNYTVSSITINGVTYSNSELSPDAEHLFTVETRYQYASVDEISNVSTAGELPVSFSDVTFENGGITYEDSDEDRIVLQSDAEGGTGSGSGGVDDYDRITVEEKDGGGYIMHYSLESDTNTKATVAQFALYANQSVLIEGLPAGDVYYVYEYAVGKESADYDSLEAQWSTVVTDIGENSTAGIQTVNEPQSYDAGGDDGEIDPSKQPHGEISGYRAYKGGIEITRTPHVLFTNSRLGNLEITKTVAGAQLPESERNREFEFKIQLVLPDGGGAAGNTYTVDAVRTTPNGTGEPVQTEFTLTFVKLDENGAESDSGTLTATAALKDGETVTLLKLPVNAEYDVTETQNDGYSVEISGETGGTISAGTAEVDFVNVWLSEFEFTKVAAEEMDQPLQGAGFSLYRLTCTNPEHSAGDHGVLLTGENECWTAVGTATSGEDGKVTFSGLYRNSEYRLVETKAPDGRVLPAGQWRITTDENNAIGEIVDVYVNGDVPPAFSGEGGGLSLPNMMALNLPVLGGQTMLTYIVMGELFILLAVLIVGRKLYVKSRGKA